MPHYLSSRVGGSRDRSDQADRTGHAEHADRPNRGERGERGDRGDRGDRGERGDSGDRHEWNDCTGRAVPGPVRGGHVPPVREIVVIEARKVFDFCFQEDLLERCFFISDLGAGAQVTSCEITNVTCNEVMNREPITDQEGLFLVSIQVNLTLRITIVPTPHAHPITVTRNIAFPKRVVLCAPTGTDVTCDVRGTCICTVQPPTTTDQGTVQANPNLCCTIQLCVTVQSTADVKVLVPTFGTVVPKQCPVSPAFGGCPPMPADVCNGFWDNDRS